MAEAASKCLTAEELLHWDDGIDTRSQLVDDPVVAMAPGEHGNIQISFGPDGAISLDSIGLDIPLAQQCQGLGLVKVGGQ